LWTVIALGPLALQAVLLTACGASEPPAPTGEILYLRHCAACHGESGRGNGPVAATLRTPPTDLTTIAARAGGRFDGSWVMRIIDGRQVVAEHGTREMPVWGAVFSEELENEPHTAYTVLLHGRALTDYVRTLQREP
jgi:mono/diheme cytochrome c family protein